MANKFGNYSSHDREVDDINSAIASLDFAIRETIGDMQRVAS